MEWVLYIWVPKRANHHSHMDYYLILQIKYTHRGVINMFLYQILACAVHGKIWKKSYRNNKFKMLAPTWNEKFELPLGYFASDIQVCHQKTLNSDW